MERIDKINQRIKEEVSSIVHQEVKDPRLGFITITQAEVSKDLQHAKVYFSVLGGDDKFDDAQKGLESAKGFIRRLVGQRIRMRYTPDILFIQDRSAEYSQQIEETLQRIKDESKSDY